MEILSSFFHKSSAEAKVLIDIGAKSVAGAYLYKTTEAVPTILYARRLPIEGRHGEPHERAMLRALSVLGEALVREGAPALMRAAGSGTVDSILVSVNAPWQHASIHTEYFEGGESFIFTKNLVDEALKKIDCSSPGKVICDESIIGTLLNGYATQNPYGKKAHRASVVILTSLVEQTVVTDITNALSSLYHTKSIILIAGSSVRYQAIRTAFPHEQNLLILDATSPLISISLVRRGLLAAITEQPDGIVGNPKWIKEVSQCFDELAKQNPLPPTIFLLTHDTETEMVEKALASARLGSLWLSDNPPKIISILPSHLISSVRQADASVPDLSLLLMAVYATHPALVH